MVPDADRITFVERFVVAARQIAETTKDEEALIFWQHLQRSAFIATPRFAQGALVTLIILRILDKENLVQGFPPLPIVPLYAEDASLNEAIKDIWEWNTAAAMHQSENNVIWLKTDHQESDFISGCQLLHEAGHSHRAVAEGRLGQTSADKITPHLFLEEGDLHYLEARLWKERGGSVYAAILDKAVYWIQKKLRGSPGFLRLQWNEDWLNVLDGVFGATPNPDARKHRMGSFAIHAHFEMIDRTSRRDKRQHRANIIHAVYKEMKHRM